MRIKCDNLVMYLYSLGTQRTIRPLSPASEKKVEETLRKMVEFYKYHGINLRTCYEDFDFHHIGKITESQVGLLYFQMMIYSF